MRNGTFRPSQVYTSNFANGQYISVYMSFVQELDCDTGNTSVSLNRSELANGYTLYAFQITDGLIGPGTYGPQSKFATKCALECVIWCCSEKKISMWFCFIKCYKARVWPILQRSRIMSVGNKLHAEEIDCLMSTFVDGVRWLWVFARDELPDVTRKIRLWCCILNTDSKNNAGTYWLAFYAPLSGGIKLCDSFSFFV